jgi:hypothetical protein
MLDSRRNEHFGSTAIPCSDEAPLRNPTRAGRAITRLRAGRAGRPEVPTRSRHARRRRRAHRLRRVARAPSARATHARRVPAVVRELVEHLAAGEELSGFLAADGEHDRRAVVSDWRRRLVDRRLAPSTVNLALAATSPGSCAPTQMLSARPCARADCAQIPQIGHNRGRRHASRHAR